MTFVRPDFAADLQRYDRALARVIVASRLDTTALSKLGAALTRAQRIEGERLAAAYADHLERFTDSPLTCAIGLFSTIGMIRLETAFTEALGWMLDSANAHGFGTQLAAALWKECGPQDDDAALGRLIESRATTEFRLDRIGRVDVFLDLSFETPQGTGAQRAIVIEAKIDATEGHGQTQRYKEHLSAESEQKRFVYLTVDGEIASEGWQPVSIWTLGDIIARQCAGLRSCPGFAWLRMFLSSVLQEIYGWRLYADGRVPGSSNVFQLAQLIDSLNGH